MKAIKRISRVARAFAAALAMAVSAVSEAAVYRVTPDASASGSGASWSDAATLANALAGAADGDTVMLKAGTYAPSATVAVTKGVAVEGGYAGTDDDALADEPLSVIDADGTTFTAVVSVTASTAGQTTTLRRLVVKNGYACGITKSGAADLLVEGCLIATNGIAAGVATPAAKGCFVDAANATVTFRDTVFRANRQEQSVSGGSSLSALRVNSAKALVVEDCGFFGNGLLMTSAPGYGETSNNAIGDKFIPGSAIYAKTKTSVVRSRFSGNCANIRNLGCTSGGVIWFEQGSSGSVVSNCLFVGNYDRASWNNTGDKGGAIVMNMSSFTHTLDVYGSTFAYNLADGTSCAAGITATKGTLVVDGCIFAGNVVNPYTLTKSRDLLVGASARATVRNTVFDSEDGSICVVEPAKGGGLVLDDSVLFSDPLLVTRPETINVLLVASNRNTGDKRFMTFGTDISVYETLEAIDAHLMSAAGYVVNGDTATWLTADVHSPAIDFAGADFEVGDETAPNGGRRDAGFYGGTAEASRSALNAPAMEESAVVVTFDETRLTATATVSGSAVFNGVLSFEVFTSDPRSDAAAAAVESATFSPIRAGDSRTFSGARLYTPGATLYVRATATTPGLDPVVVVKEATVTGTSPAFVGHGGPAESVIHVRGGAANGRDGSSWLDAYATLEEALAVAAADATKTEIWIMGTVASTGQVTTAFAPAAATLAVRGGFAGPEDTADERPVEGLSYVDGQHLYNPCIIANAKGHDVVFERVAFMNAGMNGISKTGGGDLTVRDCHFLTNGLSAWSLYSWTGKDVPGRGIRVTSASGAKVVVTNCEFRMNLQKESGKNVGAPGAALYLSGCASAEVVDSRFHANGVWMYENGAGSTSGNAIGDLSSKGSAIYAAVPTAVTRCEFSGNANNIRSSWTGGGTVWFDSGANGSAVTNCLFKGNADFAKWEQFDGKYGGAIVVCLGDASQTVDVFGSTFAYNLTDSNGAAAGMTVFKGAASLVNCVFGGGIVASSALNPSTDLRVKAAGSVTVSYTVFGGDASTSVVCETGGSVVQGSGVLFADPLFVTTSDDVAALYKRNTKYTYFYSDKYDELEAIDAHLLSMAGYVTNADKATWLTASVHSPAIDAGVGEYVNEPDFNGNCRNAGVYGNTAEASKSLKSETTISFTDVALAYPSGYSRPQLTFSVTGDAGVKVNAVVRYRVGNGEWAEAEVLGCAVGATSTLLLPEFYARGTQIEFELSGTSTAGSVVTVSETKSVESDLPPWFGRGGGDRVIHVWSGSLGDSTGKDWNGAFHTWKEAIDAYNAAGADEIDEIWVADVADPTTAATALTTKGALAIRGGFDCMAQSAEDRAAGAISTITGNKLFAPLVLVNAHEVSVERLVFTLAPQTAFAKTGAGDLTLVDCAFTNNARGAAVALEGAGLSVKGTAGTTKVSVSRCAFLDNGSTGAYNMGCGQGAYFANCASVSVEDCVFEKNGRVLGDLCARDSSFGSALFATSAPLTAKRCAFRANIGTTRDPNQNGGAVRIEGSATPTRFENCIFAGNNDAVGWDKTQLGSYGGALVVKCASAEDTVDVVNCTFAYNLSDGVTSPAGLNVYKGAVSAVNTVFWGNITNLISAAGLGVDVDVKAEGSFSARYCLFSAMDATSYSSTGGGVLSVDAETCFSADPLFATAAEDVAPLVKYGTEYTSFATGSEDALAALDVHLRGKRGYLDERTGELVKWPGVVSPAVDAGDPSTSHANEAQPNGGRVNLGAYGNTAWATLSNGGLIFIIR